MDEVAEATHAKPESCGLAALAELFDDTGAVRPAPTHRLIEDIVSPASAKVRAYPISIASLLTLALVPAAIGCRAKPHAEAQPQAQTGPEQTAAEPERAPGADAGPSFDLSYEAYTLDNGLDVILHRDTSDPVVALATIVHVGSNREQPGKTGFAHFFEHMSFNDSENVPRGANRKMIGELGGIRNGGTSSDSTTYYEVVPKDAFEKLLWIDSDRLGFMINTVTEWALENEKQVVKNEKRQRVDNVAYGHTRVVIPELLYPPDHPYHWSVIGSLEDLQAATLDDVRAFYDQYYGASNATLVIAGDIDIAETKALVERWFGEIRRGPEVAPLEPRPATLAADKSVFHVDNFAKVPELTLTFPAVERFHPDSYALDALAELLTTGKRAPLYQVVVDEGALAPSVGAGLDAREIAGTFAIRVRANDGVDLDRVQAAIDQALARFEDEGVGADDLAQIKAKHETALYERSADVLSKAFVLGNYNEFAGDPGYIKAEIAAVQALTPEDLTRVYDRYIKAKPKVITSFVPRGGEALAVEGASAAVVSEEQVVRGAEQAVAADPEFRYDKTPTTRDRSEPPLGPAPVPRAPTPWIRAADNGMRVMGIVHDELPLVRVRVRIEGGHAIDPEGKDGAAALLAKLLVEGTKTKTPEQLQDAFGRLGAEVRAYADDEGLIIETSGLARQFPALAALLTEIVLEPRWDADEFARLSAAQQTTIRQRGGQPRSIAGDVFNRALYAPGHSLATPAIGTLDSVASVTLDDLRQLWSTALSPALASVMVVGDVSQAEVDAAFARLETDWPANTFALPPQPPALAPAPDQARLYFVDVPGSKQSVLVVGQLALAGDEPHYNELTYANDALGAGSKSRLFQLLRIEKGYTYGASSRIPRWRYVAPFMASSSVRANVTLESLELIRDQLQGYAQTYTQADLDLSKSALTKRAAGTFESLPALMRVLDDIARLDLAPNYLELERRELDAMTLDQAHALIEQYLDAERMVYVVVGDAATQLDQVRRLGLGEPVQVDAQPASPTSTGPDSGAGERTPPP